VVFRVEDSGRLHPVELGEQGLPESFEVHQDNGATMPFELSLDEDLGQFLERSEPTGQDHVRIPAMGQSRLAAPHVLDRLQFVQPRVGNAREGVEDDAFHTTSRSQRRIGQSTHEADVGASVDQGPASLGDSPTQRTRQFEKGGRSAAGRSGIDRDALDRRHGNSSRLEPRFATRDGPGHGFQIVHTTPFVFLDRDGTLIEDVGYGHRPEDYHLIPGVLAALGRLRDAGFRLAMVTNQSGIGRGLFTLADYESFHACLMRDLDEAGIPIEKTWMCPHAPGETCVCRKPNPSSLQEAERDLGTDLARSWVIGDHVGDVALAAAGGCRGILVLTGHGVEERDRLGDTPVDAVVADLTEAVDYILAQA
jgi:D-glycero-D-manno-heptose 1,7-bisphosphate phosphatase